MFALNNLFPSLNQFKTLAHAETWASVHRLVALFIFGMCLSQQNLILHGNETTNLCVTVGSNMQENAMPPPRGLEPPVSCISGKHHTARPLRQLTVYHDIHPFLGKAYPHASEQTNNMLMNPVTGYSIWQCVLTHRKWEIEPRSVGFQASTIQLDRQGN